MAGRKTVATKRTASRPAVARPAAKTPRPAKVVPIASESSGRSRKGAAPRGVSKAGKAAPKGEARLRAVPREDDVRVVKEPRLFAAHCSRNDALAVRAVSGTEVWCKTCRQWHAIGAGDPAS